jgi:hypothetical protein
MDTVNSVALPVSDMLGRLNRAETIELKSLSDRINIAPVTVIGAEWDFDNRALRLHMLGSIFCGKYPLEMRQSRRFKDSY